MHLLLYDSDCGPCTRFRNIVDFLDTRRRICFLGLALAEKDGLLNIIPSDRRYRSFHLVDQDGTVASGVAALGPLVGLLPAGRTFERIMGLSVPVSFVTRIVYNAFLRLHDSGSCAHPSPGFAKQNVGAEELGRNPPRH